MHTYSFRKLAFWRNIGNQKFLDALSRSIVSVIARRIKSLSDSLVAFTCSAIASFSSGDTEETTAMINAYQHLIDEGNEKNVFLKNHCPNNETAMNDLKGRGPILEKKYAGTQC